MSTESMLAAHEAVTEEAAKGERLVAWIRGRCQRTRSDTSSPTNRLTPFLGFDMSALLGST